MPDDNDVSSILLTEVTDNMTKINSVISDATCKLNSNFSNMLSKNNNQSVLLENIMSELSCRSRKINDGIKEKIGKTKYCLSEANGFISEIASIDMNVTLEKKSHVDEVLTDTENLNKLLSSSIQDFSEITSSLKIDVTQAVTALQYEDIVSQLSATSTMLISKESEKKQLISNYSNSKFYVIAIVDGIKNIISKLNNEKSEKIGNKQVVQSEMLEGEINLF